MDWPKLNMKPNPLKPNAATPFGVVRRTPEELRQMAERLRNVKKGRKETFKRQSGGGEFNIARPKYKTIETAKKDMYARHKALGRGGQATDYTVFPLRIPEDLRKNLDVRNPVSVETMTGMVKGPLDYAQQHLKQMKDVGHQDWKKLGKEAMEIVLGTGAVVTAASVAPEAAPLLAAMTTGEETGFLAIDALTKEFAALTI